MNTTVCGVLTANSHFKIYTVSMLDVGADNYHTKTKKCNEMPNNCSTMYIFLPPPSHNSHKHFHICTQPKSKLSDLLHGRLSWEDPPVTKFPVFITLFMKNWNINFSERSNKKFHKNVYRGFSSDMQTDTDKQV